MRRVFLPRHFLASGLLLLILASLYVFIEAQRLQQELLRQTEDKGTALAKAMETSVKNAIVGNALLEELIRQRLVDNARLIDQLLLSRHVDQALLKEISAMNRLQKIEPDLRAVRDDLAHARSDLDLARCRITGMESSKFWKLRRIWFRFQRALGLSRAAIE